VAGLVGEFAEIDLVGVGCAGQHADIGAGAEHPVLAGAQQHHLDAGMLETQPLHRIRELDIDPEVVGIELELIAFEQPAILVDIHGQGSDLAVDIELPVPVARRLGLEIDGAGATSEDAIFTGHWATLGLLNWVAERTLCTIMHVFGKVQLHTSGYAFCCMLRPPWSYVVRPRELPSLDKTAAAKAAIASSVGSGTSRCGEWPAPGIIITSTGQ